MDQTRCWKRCVRERDRLRRSRFSSARPDRLKALLELAREKGVPVHRVPRLDLDRSLGDVRHQGVVARIAAARYADPDVLLDQLESKIGTADPPLVVGPRRDRGSA